MKILMLPQSWSGRALVVTAVENAEQWFEGDEIPTFALPKRRVEWMLSRIAAKELGRRLGTASDVASYSSKLSLSHSGGYGAAAFDEKGVGIDIERPRNLNPAAAHLFLSDQETEAMERCAIPNALLHFWCAKEAAWKERGGAVVTLKQVPLRLEAETPDGLIFDLVETFASEVVVALTRPKE